MTVGLDLSYTSTGIAYIDDRTLETEAVKTTSSIPWIDRVHIIRDAILRYIEPNATVYIENYAFGSTWGRESLGELGGVVREALESRGVRIIKIAPTKVKMFATGKGKAPACPPGKAKSTWPKKWMMEKVKENFGYDFNTDDETDAFVIATIGYTVETALKHPSILEQLPPHQRKVVIEIIKEEFNDGKIDS